MKLRGGEWSKGDVIALLGLVLAVAGVVAAILAIPGMPKVLHYDSDSSHADASATDRRNPTPAPRSINQTRDVTSGQVNFGCEQTLNVETPVISFGRNPRNIESHASWERTDNVKTQNQSVVNVEDPADHHTTGIKAAGTMTGVDYQNLVVTRNCPGGGHGELTLHATWTEDQ